MNPLFIDPAQPVRGLRSGWIDLNDPGWFGNPQFPGEPEILPDPVIP